MGGNREEPALFSERAALTGEREMRTTTWIGLAGVAVMMACGDDPVTTPTPVPPEATVFSATGRIGATVSQFRAILGTANGGTAGEQPAGRREINWDYAAQFLFFSATNVFAPIGSNQFDQLFQVAGQPTPALVRGFGVVFSDVDLADQTTIQLFAQDGSSLGTYGAPVRSDEGGFSFVGVTFADAIIARVRITLGTGALGADVNDVSAGGTVDLVVVDNLIYSEPRNLIHP